MKLKVIKLSLFIFGFLFSLLIFSTSLNVRMWADDFCTVAVLNQRGFWGSQLFSWLSWSGRYSYNFFIYFFMLFGSKVVSFVPILTFYLFVFALWTVFINLLIKKEKMLALLLSLALVLIIFINTPNIIQSLYWFGGVLIYTFPFIFFNLFLLLLLIYAKRGKSNINILSVFSFFTLFIATGFSESLLLIYFVFIVYCFIVELIINSSNKKRVLTILFFGALGVLTSFVFMYIAPGTAARANTLDKPFSLMWVISSSYNSTFSFLTQLLARKPFWYSIVLIFSLMYFIVDHLIIKLKTKLNYLKSLLIVFLSLISSVFCVYSLYFTSFYSMAYHPPERALIIPIYFIFLYLTFSFFIILKQFSLKLDKSTKRYLGTIMVILFCMATVLLVRDTYRRWKFLKNDIRTYADAWDIEEKKVIQAKKTGNKVVIKYIPMVGRIDGFLDNKGWVSGCASGYFGISEFVVE